MSPFSSASASLRSYRATPAVRVRRPRAPSRPRRSRNSRRQSCRRCGRRRRPASWRRRAAASSPGGDDGDQRGGLAAFEGPRAAAKTVSCTGGLEAEDRSRKTESRSRSTEGCRRAKRAGRQTGEARRERTILDTIPNPESRAPDERQSEPVQVACLGRLGSRENASLRPAGSRLRELAGVAIDRHEQRSSGGSKATFGRPASAPIMNRVQMGSAASEPLRPSGWLSSKPTQTAVSRFGREPHEPGIAQVVRRAGLARGVVGEAQAARRAPRCPR